MYVKNCLFLFIQRDFSRNIWDEVYIKNRTPLVCDACHCSSSFICPLNKLLVWSLSKLFEAVLSEVWNHWKCFSLLYCQIFKYLTEKCCILTLRSMWFIDQDLSSAFTKLTLTKSFIIAACSFNGFDMRYKSKQDFICQYLTFHSSSVVGYRSVMSGCTLLGNIMLNANKMQLAI